MKNLECINCDAAFEPKSLNRVLYCSDVCRETAGVVRYIRSAHSRHSGEGDLDEDIKIAIRVKIASAIKGGYPQSRILSKETRQAVLERDENTCQVCGSPGNEIHHLTNDPEVLNEPSNLQTICNSCHLRISDDSLVLTDEPEIKSQIRDIRRRGRLPEPERECDDHQNWAKRRQNVENERRAILREIRYASIRQF